jgi:hypothetical protein
MRRAIFQGQEVWVDDNGQIIGISQGMYGAVPGLSDARARDLMSRLPDADIVGLQGHGVVPGGEQHAGGKRVISEQVNLPQAGATFRPLAGAQINNRGNVQTVTLQTATGGPEQLIQSIVETAKSGGQDAESLIIQLGLDFAPQLLTDVNYQEVPVDVTALIEWGVGNAFFSSEVDWNQGIGFSIAASFLRVSARVGPIPVPGLPPGPPNVDIVLRASLGYGTAASLGVSSLPRRTLDLVPRPTGYQGILPAATASSIFPIPPWSMGMTLIDGGGPGGTPVIPDYTIKIFEGLLNAPSAVYKMVSRTNLAQQVEGQFPIPRRGRNFQIINNLGVAVIGPKAIFNLGF